MSAWYDSDETLVTRDLAGNLRRVLGTVYETAQDIRQAARKKRDACAHIWRAESGLGISFACTTCGDKRRTL